MAAVVIGALRVDLGLSTAAFKKDANAAAREAEQLGARVKKVGMGMAAGGAAITAGITMPFVGLMKSAIPAAIAHNEAVAQVNAGLASMGPVAGKTSEQLQEIAKQLQATSSVDDDDILRDLTANMLTFGNVAGNEFDRAQQAALDMSVRMKTDLKSSAILVGKALNDPVKGLTAMSRAGVTFTEQQKDQVKAMVKAGDTAGAQALMLAELEKQFKGSAQAERDAAPGSDTVDAWREFNEILGAIALDLLPTVTDALTGALNAFNTLSPGTQRFAIIALGVVAALGPVLIIIGAVTTAIGSMIAIGPVLGAFFAGIKAGLMSLMLSPLGLVIIAIGAVVAAWYYWDEIVAIVKGVGDAVSAWYSQNIKPTVDLVVAAFKGIVDFFKAVFGPVIEAQIGIISALLSGDFAGAFQVAKDFAVNALGGILSFMGEMVPRALGFVANLANGVRQWIVGKLGATFDWLRGKLDAVGGYFFDLYDKVVGHSYIPDMVDGIAAQMSRLQSVMVDPAKRAAASTKEVMRNLAQDTHDLLSRLFPEIEKAKTYRAELDLIDKADLTDDQKTAARRRLGKEVGGSTREKFEISTKDPGSLADRIDFGKFQTDMDEVIRKGLPELEKKTFETTQKMVESFADMTRNVLGSLRGMVSSFKSGDIIGGIIGLADLISQVIGGIAAIKGVGAKQGSTGYQTPNYGGTRALGGAVVPGKRYRIGERGPEYVSFGQRGQITPDNDNTGRGTVVNFNGVMTSDEFWSKIDDLDNQSAQRGAMAGASFIQDRANKRARTRLGRG